MSERHWLLDYPREWLRPDVIAGLTAAAVVIPKAMAYATIAGLPVQVGLYTAFVPLLVYALLGTSRPLSTSTSGTLAILAAAQLASVQGPEATEVMATLTAQVGIALLIAWGLRLGFVANFISDPVLTGFKAGIGLVIVVDQVPKLLGIHFDKGTFLENCASIVRGIPDTSLPTLAVAAATIGVLVAMEHWSPRAPAPLVAVAGGIGASALLGLESYGVATVGAVPRGLPALTVPDPALASTLWAAALGIALMSFTETIAAGRAFAAPDEPAPVPNRELLATGIANVAGAFLGSMPSGGGTSQTAVNRLAGARSQVAQIVTAMASLLVLLLFAPFLAHLPEPTLGAVVVVYSITLVQPREFRAILAIRRREFSWAVVATVGVIALGTLRGILVAILVSMIALTRDESDPPVHALGRKRGTNVFRPVTPQHEGDETFPGLLLVRVEGRTFFANVQRISEKISALADANTKVVAIEMSGVADLEYTALKVLVESERRLRERGVSVWLVDLNEAVLAAVRRSGLYDTLGPERLHYNLELAVAAYENRAPSGGTP